MINNYKLRIINYMLKNSQNLPLKTHKLYQTEPRFQAKDRKQVLVVLSILSFYY